MIFFKNHKANRVKNMKASNGSVDYNFIKQLFSVVRANVQGEG